MKMLAVLMGLCLVFVFVWERVDMVRLGYHVERLKHEKVLLERERDELRVKVATLSSPDRIAKVATDKYGMSLPQPGQVVMVQSGPADWPAASRQAPEIRIAKVDMPGGRR
ncbi:cell division protein FtsL [Nitrospira sp. NS4]|uniref:cell division protein FtsL n=1 Tax=Nitrospira sp. NS4 TaxID=3414498 RepID=UPI003C2E4C80